MNNLYFDNIIQLNRLYLDFVFYEFESEPIIFTCIDDQEKIYFCLCSEIRYQQKWIITECDIATLTSIIEEEIDIATPFLAKPHLIGISMDIQGNETSYIIEHDKLDRLDLPKEGTYIKCNKEKALDYIWNKKWKAIYRKFKPLMKSIQNSSSLVNSYGSFIDNTAFVQDKNVYETFISKQVSLPNSPSDDFIYSASEQNKTIDIKEKTFVTVDCGTIENTYIDAA